MKMLEFQSFNLPRARKSVVRISNVTYKSIVIFKYQNQKAKANRQKKDTRQKGKLWMKPQRLPER